ncbi:MAG TPA: helix-turn-helix domain-containing protein [Planctomycetota bacterium]|nr:helix-turn-helix domain-containing protein [Planctomycetota bacterium]HRR79712.1 helix-turn-helix domain-containing protein [Planctomycetota bacterium]HRT97271.1 helix-turn-helix domain-containing protein [Planctomycetota bacterium]
MDESRPVDGAVSAGAAKRWYTVPEAAEYLGISVPTIFRWMREGRLSFVKIGGATRFTREGLEALIEKTTGSAEAEAAAGRCAACGHSVLVEGNVQGTGRLYFHPEKTRFWVFAESLVPIRARVCTACGHIQLQADTAKLNRLVPKSSETPETP